MTEIRRVKKPEWKWDAEKDMDVLSVDNGIIVACKWYTPDDKGFEGRVFVGGNEYSHRKSNMEHELQKMLEDDLLYLADEIRIAAGRFITIYREVPDDSGSV